MQAPFLVVALYNYGSLDTGSLSPSTARNLGPRKFIYVDNSTPHQIKRPVSVLSRVCYTRRATDEVVRPRMAGGGLFWWRLGDKGLLDLGSLSRLRALIELSGFAQKSMHTDWQPSPLPASQTWPGYQSVTLTVKDF